MDNLKTQKTTVKYLTEYYTRILPEAKRKDANIAQAVEEAISALQAILERKKDLHGTIFLRPLEMVFASGMTKCFPYALSVLQSLAGENLLGFEEKLSLVKHFVRIVDTGDDMTCIKILQILLLVLTSSDIPKPPLCTQCLSLCLKGYMKKNTIVRNTVLSVLRHQYSVLLELLKQSFAASPTQNIEHSELLNVICEQFEQLVLLISEDQKNISYKGLGLDLLAFILQEGIQCIPKSPALRNFIEKSVSLQLPSYFHNYKSLGFGLFSKTVKVSTQIMLCVQGSYFLLNLIINLCNSSIVWVRYIVLESICELVGAPDQLSILHTLQNSETHIRALQELIQAFWLIARNLPERSLDDKQSDYLKLIRNNKDLGNSSVVDSPKIVLSNFLSLLGEVSLNFIEKLNQMFEKGDRPISGSVSDSPPLKIQTNSAEILAYSWKPLYEVLIFMVKEIKQETSIQMYLDGINSLICISGRAKMNNPVYIMLKGICLFCLPMKLEPYLNYASKESKMEIGFKHIFISNAILKIAQSIHDELDQNAWLIVFEAMQKISTYILKAEYQCTNLPPNTVHFNTIGKRVSENLYKFTCLKFESPGQFKEAGTGGEEEKIKEETESPAKNIHSEKNEESIKSAKVFNFEGFAEEPPRKRSSLSHFSSAENHKVSHLHSLIMDSQESPRDIIVAPKSANMLPPAIENVKSTLESLFSLTSQFSNDTLYKFVMGLGEITLNMLESLSELVERKTKAVEISFFDKLNMFGLIHMLETAIINIDRISILWASVVAHFDCLLYSKYSQLRLLAIDSLSCLITNIFLYYKDTHCDNPNVLWKGRNWQSLVLQPLLNSLNSGFAECFKGVLNNLPNIIDNCCEFFSPNAWEILNKMVDKFIPSVLAGSGGEVEERVDLAFKCISHIVHNHLHSVDSISLNHLINAVHKFAGYKGDISIPVIAVELMHTMVDYVCKAEEGTYFKDHTNDIILSIISHIKEIACSERVELRHAACRALEYIMVENGEHMNLKLWQQIFIDVLSQLFHKLEVHFLACRTDKGTGIQFATPTNIATPKFSLGHSIGENKGGSKIKFDEESLRKSTEETRLKEKHYEESLCIFLVCYVRIFSKFCQVATQDRPELREWAYLLLVETCVSLVKKGTYTIINTVMKSLSQLLETSKDSVFGKFHDTWKIFHEYVIWLEKSDAIKVQRPVGSRHAATVIEVLYSLYKPIHTLKYPVLQSLDIINQTFTLLKHLLVCSKQSEGFQGIALPQKLMEEEEVVFKYIEQWEFLSEEAQKLYIEFIFGFLDFKIDDPHMDAYIRRTLSIFEHHIVYGIFPASLIKEILPILYEKFEILIDLRYKSDSCKMLLFQSQDVQPLWFEVGMSMKNISTFFINSEYFEKEEVSESEDMLPQFGTEREETQEPLIKEEPIKIGFRKKPTLGIEIPGEESSPFSVVPNPIIVIKKPSPKHTVELAKDVEIQEIIWHLTFKGIKKILDVSEKSLANLEKQLAKMVIKKSQDLGIIFINFIFTVLLPNSSTCSEEHQKELIAMIDEGSMLYSSFGSMTQFAPDSLSKHCLNTLIDLCVEECEPLHYAEAREKIASIAAPILIKRCKTLIANYLLEEKRSGMVPMKKESVTDILELFDKLEKVRILPNSLPQNNEIAQALFQRGRGHLLCLMPDLINCCSSKQPEVREKTTALLSGISTFLIDELAIT